MNQNLPEQFQNILDKYHMPSSHIILELTETAVSQNASMLEETMLKLSDMGFSFSMDDYGTGYSNFSYIVQLPFSIIKLDKSLLWGAEKK